MGTSAQVTASLGSKAIRAIVAAAALYGYWLVLSGHYAWWLVISGGVLSVAVILFCLLKGVTDEEGFPIELIPRGLLYWPWLLGQIVLSALNVTRIILSPKLPISPTLTRVRSKTRTAVGLTTYANSITLTPGTISVEASERQQTIWVHAIEETGADFDNDPMNDWVAWFEGRR